MSEGTCYKNGPAVFQEQGRAEPRGAFLLSALLVLHCRKLFVQAVVAMIILLSPLVPANAAATSQATKFFAKHPWMQSWTAKGELDAQYLYSLLGNLEIDKQVIKWMNHQAEAKAYHKYRKLFISDERVAGGKRRFAEYAAVLNDVEGQYLVDKAILVALWGVESGYGARTGNFQVLRTLYTLSTAYPRREKFFRTQLYNFLLLCKEEGFAPQELKGSYAGAMGQVQMIPETMRRYAVDFDGDGSRDVFHSPVDVLASIASYLRGHGWQQGGKITIQPQQKPALKALLSPSLGKMQPWSWWQQQGVSLPLGVVPPAKNEKMALIMLEERNGPRYHLVFKNFWVITRWNRSSRFAMVVHELANRIRELH